MQELNLVQQLAVWALPVIFAITVHEVAHGWVARRFGDPTAEMLGRLTLNPLKHIDPIGTILVPAILLWAGGILFGWARPVPVNPENLRNPRRDMALVALAGPAANLVMALIWAVLLKISLMLSGTLGMVALPLAYMAQAGITINVLLMVLNLVPLPPLDGSRVAAGFLPPRWGDTLLRAEPYGLLVLLLLLVTGVLGHIVLPPVYAVEGVLYRVFGL
ncbi:MAG TPA: site-2 protease family protein [Gammaproteobacteria bacterium]|nr:site-2 protease family protein [Gammaproteobacteria bacterium]